MSHLGGFRESDQDIGDCLVGATDIDVEAPIDFAIRVQLGLPSAGLSQCDHRCESRLVKGRGGTPLRCVSSLSLGFPLTSLVDKGSAKARNGDSIQPDPSPIKFLEGTWRARNLDPKQTACRNGL